MLLNCGVEDSWESHGLQGDPTSAFWRRSVLGVLWKEWCWSWNSSTLATWCKELTHWKRPCCWEGLEAGGKGDDRGWDGWMASLTWWMWVWVDSGSWWWTGRPGVLCAVHGVTKSLTWLSDWTELNWTDDRIKACVPHKISNYSSTLFIRKTLLKKETFYIVLEYSQSQHHFFKKTFLFLVEFFWHLCWNISYLYTRRRLFLTLFYWSILSSTLNWFL